MKSIGFALTSCTVPAKGTPTFELSNSELEFGVGIHGEPGVAKQEMRTADELATDCIELLVNDLPFNRDDEVALMINGFGATPLQELYVLNNSVHRLLAEKGIMVHNTLVGNYMTALDMAGASVTMLKLDDELKEYLAAPVDTVALRGV